MDHRMDGPVRVQGREPGETAAKDVSAHEDEEKEASRDGPSPLVVVIDLDKPIAGAADVGPALSVHSPQVDESESTTHSRANDDKNTAIEISGARSRSPDQAQRHAAPGEEEATRTPSPHHTSTKKDNKAAPKRRAGAPPALHLGGSGSGRGGPSRPTHPQQRGKATTTGTSNSSLPGRNVHSSASSAGNRNMRRSASASFPGNHSHNSSKANQSRTPSTFVSYRSNSVPSKAPRKDGSAQRRPPRSPSMASKQSKQSSRQGAKESQPRVLPTRVVRLPSSSSVKAERGSPNNPNGENGEPVAAAHRSGSTSHRLRGTPRSIPAGGKTLPHNDSNSNSNGKAERSAASRQGRRGREDPGAIRTSGSDMTRQYSRSRPSSVSAAVVGHGGKPLPPPPALSPASRGLHRPAVASGGGQLGRTNSSNSSNANTWKAVFHRQPTLRSPAPTQKGERTSLWGPSPQHHARRAASVNAPVTQPRSGANAARRTVSSSSRLGGASPPPPSQKAKSSSGKVRVASRPAPLAGAVRPKIFPPSSSATAVVPVVPEPYVRTSQNLSQDGKEASPVLPAYSPGTKGASDVADSTSARERQQDLAEVGTHELALETEARRQQSLRAETQTGEDSTAMKAATSPGATTDPVAAAVMAREPRRQTSGVNTSSSIREEDELLDSDRTRSVLNESDEDPTACLACSAPTHSASNRKQESRMSGGRHAAEKGDEKSRRSKGGSSQSADSASPPPPPVESRRLVFSESLSARGDGEGTGAVSPLHAKTNNERCRIGGVSIEEEEEASPSPVVPPLPLALLQKERQSSHGSGDSKAKNQENGKKSKKKMKKKLQPPPAMHVFRGGHHVDGGDAEQHEDTTFSTFCHDVDAALYDYPAQADSRQQQQQLEDELHVWNRSVSDVANEEASEEEEEDGERLVMERQLQQQSPLERLRQIREAANAKAAAQREKQLERRRSMDPSATRNGNESGTDKNHPMTSGVRMGELSPYPEIGITTSTRTTDLADRTPSEEGVAWVGENVSQGDEDEAASASLSPSPIPPRSSFP